MKDLKTIYPVSSSLLDSLPSLTESNLLNLAEFLEAHPEFMRSHMYLADLARIEAARYSLISAPPPLPRNLTATVVNPALFLLEVQWRDLPELLHQPSSQPSKGNAFILVWQKQDDTTIQTAEADPHDLAALKITSEQIDHREAAREAEVSIGEIDDILFRAVRKGLLLQPVSSIVRSPQMNRGEVDNPQFFTTPTFTLQWHITQTCDLHCRHCYDRSARKEPDLEYCISVLDQLYDFCQDHHVFPQVTFTGGNPMLYPYFNELYREAADRGFMTAILGNPMPRKRIEEMLAIQKPELYQVSLEGLQEHNDYIRGEGHYERVFDFLDLLRELGIYSMVMLTLTKANRDQILPLAERLQDRVDFFTFNRLAMVGEGAELASVPPEEYRDFLQAYLDAQPDNPCMGLKDNLINILHREKKEPFFGGCAGRGCGAAFNFLALLPDGEVHACRKFPSFIGNLHHQSLHDTYHSELASKYRAGSQACSDCSIRPVCGGCLAVTHGFGLDIFAEKDPYCFL